MRIAVLTDGSLKEELLNQGINGPAELIWLTNCEELESLSEIDGCIDLLFESGADHISSLKKISTGPVLVNSVTGTLKDLPSGFVRFNGWPTFLKRAVIESACMDSSLRKKTEVLFSIFNKKTEWVEDKPGFITSRIISMIINEAYFALEEGVSTKQEMDTAMKLGTNYPYGPFEWAEKIGKGKIVSLLNELCKKEFRFSPAPRLQNEIIK